MKVYTKTGDKGTTSLFNGERVAKSSTRLESYGTVDEANSFIGLLSDKLELHPKASTLTQNLQTIQKELFCLGSELATPKADLIKLGLSLVDKEAVSRLESEMDLFNKDLTPLKNFVIPGGHEAVSLAHVVRTVVRRAERHVEKLMEQEDVREIPLIYLNRLSDWFFVTSRYMSVLLEKPERVWET